MSRQFLLLSFFMGVVVLSSNYLVQFPIKHYGLENVLTYGAFSYPIAFLITDLANRSYGKIAARKIVYIGFATGILFTFLFSTNFSELISIIMRHEGFDFTVDVWDEKHPKSDETDVWSGNIAVSNLIFDDKSLFNEKLGKYFSIEHEELSECLIFLNSGGVTSKTFYIPMNNFFMKILDIVDKILIKIFPIVLCMGRKIVLVKN